MKYNPNIHNRKSIRLKGYNYSQAGLYFVTICCQNRTHFYGKIIDKEMILNDAGKIIEKWYYELDNKFTDIKCHEMIVMPNHFHCIIEIIVGADLRVCPKYPNINKLDERMDKSIGEQSNILGEQSNISGEQSNISGEQSNISGEQSNILGEQSNILGEQSNILGEQSNILGEQSNILGEQSNILGEQSNILGEQSNISGEQSNILGEQSNILGEQSNILGEQSNILGEQSNISGEQSNISGEQSNILGEHTGSPLHRVVQWFKTMTTNEYIRNVKSNGWKRFDGKLWQRNYWEHIIRNQNSYQNISEYIISNPLNWKKDTLRTLN